MYCYCVYPAVSPSANAGRLSNPQAGLQAASAPRQGWRGEAKVPVTRSASFGISGTHRATPRDGFAASTSWRRGLLLIGVTRCCVEAVVVSLSLLFQLCCAARRVCESIFCPSHLVCLLQNIVQSSVQRSVSEMRWIVTVQRREIYMQQLFVILTNIFMPLQLQNCV